MTGGGASLVATAVPWVLSLFGIRLPEPVAGGLSTAAAVLGLASDAHVGLARFAGPAVDRLGSLSTSELVGLSAADKEAVVERLPLLLDGGSRQRLLGAALLGRNEFLAELVGDGHLAYDGLGPDGQGYLHSLVTEVHGMVLSLAQTPEVIGLASVGALRQLNAELDRIPSADQIRAQVRAAVAGELSRRPPQTVEGDRPRLAAAFVFRSELEHLRSALADDGLVTLCALNGMRGVGKSQLASAIAQECEKAGWSFVGWVNASTRDAALAQLSTFAHRAGVTEEDDPFLAASDLISWLGSGFGSAKRLLVFDNVEDADDLAGLIPRGNGMKVVVTTTIRVSSLGRSIPVDVFDEGQAVDFLESLTQLGDPEGAAKVARELAYLPLALGQSATAVRLLGWNYDDYLTTLTKVALDDAVERESGDPYPAKVGAALRIAYRTVLDLLDKDGRAVADAAWNSLQALSVLAEVGVPRGWLHANSDDDLAGRRAVGQLIRHSLASETNEAGVVSIHRLLARVLREDAWKEARQDDVAWAAIHVLVSAVRDEPIGFSERRRSVAQLSGQLKAISVQPHSEFLVDRPEVVTLAGYVVRSAPELEDAQSAIQLAEYAGVSARINGPDHLDTLTIRANLGAAHMVAGDAADAIPLLESLLKEAEELSGSNHPSALAIRNNLARCYRLVGRLDDAITQYTQVADRHSSPEPESGVDQLVARNNLAFALQQAGRLDEAIVVYAENLSQRELALGLDHPDTLVSRMNMASALEESGRVSEAIRLLESVVPDAERTLGSDHPHTLNAKTRLAEAHQTAGNVPFARDLLSEVYSARESIHGPHHPQSLSVRGDYARACREAGDLEQAISIYRQVLSDLITHRGEDDPATLITRGNLGMALLEAGEPDEAISLLEQDAIESERILGPAHPHTLVGKLNLGSAFAQHRDPLGGTRLLRQAAADCEQVLGGDHPQTLKALNLLADAYRMIGNSRRAIQVHERVLAAQERILDPLHPDTLRSRVSLASDYQSSGDPERTISLLAAALRDSLQVWGPSHETTLEIRNDLAFACLSLGRAAEAIVQLEELLPLAELTFGELDERTLLSRASLGRAYLELGDEPRAASILKAVHPGFERVFGVDHPRTRELRNDLMQIQ